GTSSLSLHGALPSSRSCSPVCRCWWSSCSSSGRSSVVSRTPAWPGSEGTTLRRIMLAALSCVLASSLAAAPASAAPRRPGDGPLPVTGDVVVHDPTMIRARGDYIVYSTHGLIEARVSRDMKHFTRAGDAFTEPPAWWREYSPENDPWAPDISFHNGRYLLYYAVSSFGS